MRCATFVEQKENAANCEEFSQALGKLLILILERSPRVRDFAGLLDPKLAHGEEFTKSLELIYDDLLDAPDANAQSFFNELQNLHDATKPVDWSSVLGDVVECAFSTLVSEKYKNIGTVEHYRECRVHLSFSNAKFSTSKPIDVIAWIEEKRCGEFVEVKKNITTLRGPKISKKIAEMNQLKVDLDAYTQQNSFVGFGTLAIVEEPAEGHILSLLGYSSSGEDRKAANLRLRVVNFNTLYKWLDLNVTAQN